MHVTQACCITPLDQPAGPTDVYHHRPIPSLAHGIVPEACNSLLEKTFWYCYYKAFLSTVTGSSSPKIAPGWHFPASPFTQERLTGHARDWTERDGLKYCKTCWLEHAFNCWLFKEATTFNCCYLTTVVEPFQWLVVNLVLGYLVCDTVISHPGQPWVGWCLQIF